MQESIKNFTLVYSKVYGKKPTIPCHWYLDLLSMQMRVMALWDNSGIQYSFIDNAGDGENPAVTELIAPWADDVLNDPVAMLSELGYKPGDFATYVAEQRKELCN